MRLHLLIHRHDLPPTRILWTTPVPHPSSEQPSAASSFTGVPYTAAPAARGGSRAASFTTAQTSFTTGSSSGPGPAGSSYTISQLLQDVNEVVPLETQPGEIRSDQNEGHWGLEDYVVELLGSECLHFMEADALLRDGDEVVIRPLGIDDLAARRMTGRHQVASDGTHLIDGEPFGKQHIKRPTLVRPSIAIPPRKRRRIERSALEDDVSAVSSDYPHDHEVNEPYDGSRQQVADVHEQGKSRGYLTTNSTRAQDGARGGPSGTAEGLSKIVETRAPEIKSFGQPNVRRKVVKVTPVSPSSSASSSSSSSSSSSESGSDSDSLGRSDSSSSDSSSSDESSDSESEPDSATKHKSKTSETQAMNPPGTGSRKTRNSNVRTKLRRRLEYMKTAGLLHKDANFADLRAFDEGENKGLTSSTTGGESRQAEKEKAEFEKKRAQLLRDLESGGVDVSAASDSKTDKVREKVRGPTNNVSSPGRTAAEASSEKPAHEIQGKLDTAGARRLLFGSLGVRAPKTKEDEERTRNQLAARSARANQVIKTTTDEETPKRDTPALQPVDNWQDFLLLRATECVHETVELSNPPFPFVQRWNKEDQKAINACRKNSSSGAKKRKRKSAPQPESYEAQQSYGGYGENDDYSMGELHLDYGDDGGEYQTKQLGDASVEPTFDDLPPLPADISALEPIKRDNVRACAVIAFKQLDVSKESNWQPVVSDYRTAVVEEVFEDTALQIRLAKRDRKQIPPISEESDGRRIYSKFEMPGYDEVEDDGIRDVTFDDLLEPKLLRRGGSPSSPPEGIEKTSGTCLVPDSMPANKVAVVDTPPPVSSQTRHDISEIIRDAGFRSAIDSDLAVPGDQHVVSETYPDQIPGHNGGGSFVYSDGSGSPVKSPTFGGFDASPDPNVSISIPGNDAAETSSSLHPNHTNIVNGSQPVVAEKNSSSSHLAAQKTSLPDSLPVAPSDDGLHYLTETDPTVGQREQNQADDHQTTMDGPPSPNPQSLQEIHVDSSPESTRFSSLPQTVEDSQHRPDSNGSSVVPNPFYEIHRENEARKAEELPEEGPPSTTSARLEATSAETTSQPNNKRKGRRKASSSRMPASLHSENEDELPELPAASASQTGPKSQPESMVAMSQIPKGSSMIDLTLSSDPVSPENSDGDYAASQGLPRGPGWVSKKYPKSRQRRSSSSKDDAPSHTRRRGNLRRGRSVI